MLPLPSRVFFTALLVYVMSFIYGPRSVCTFAMKYEFDVLMMTGNSKADVCPSMSPYRANALCCGSTSRVVRDLDLYEYALAWLRNTVLIGLFGIAHSVAASGGAREFWIRLGVHPRCLRIVFLAATAATWQLYSRAYTITSGHAADQPLWDVLAMLRLAEATYVYGVRVGFSFVFAAIGLTGVIQFDPTRMYGFRQLWDVHGCDELHSATTPELRTSWLYGVCRHPQYLSVFLMESPFPFLKVSLPQLLHWGIWTAYLYIGIIFEERKLVRMGSSMCAIRRPLLVWFQEAIEPGICSCGAARVLRLTSTESSRDSVGVIGPWRGRSYGPRARNGWRRGRLLEGQGLLRGQGVCARARHLRVAISIHPRMARPQWRRGKAR